MAKTEIQTEGQKPKQRIRGDSDPLIDKWKRRIELAEKKLRESGGDMSTDGEWKQMIRFYEGVQWGGLTPKGSERRFHKITSNIVKASIDSLRPQLYFQNPKVSIELKNPYVLPEDVPVMTVDPMTGQAVPQMQTVPAPPPPAPPQQPGPPQPGMPQQGGPPQPQQAGGPPPPQSPQMMQGMPPQSPQMMQVPVIKFPKGTAVAKIGNEWVDAEMQVQLFEAIDNYYLSELGFKQIARRVLNDALVLPYGVVKTEWLKKIKMVKVPVYSEPEGIKTGEEEQEQPIYEGPSIRRIKPWQFLVDPELDEFDLGQARWVAEINFYSHEELKADPNLKIDKLPDTRHVLDGGEEYTSELDSESKQDCQRFKVYEIHDLEHDCLMVWVEGCERFARFESPNPYSMVEGSVYSILGFDERLDDFFPLSKPQQIKTKQEAYNFVLSYMMNHIRRFNRKYTVQRGSVNPDNMSKLEEGPDGAVIEVDGQPPQPISDANISPDMYNVKNVLKQEITEEIGVTAMNRGTNQPGADTAYEVSQIQGGADIKVQEMRDIVRDWVRLVVRKLNQILKEYATGEQVIQVAGPKGVHWAKWTREDIQGEFIEDVDIYTSMPFSEEVERKQAMEMFSLVQQDPYFDPYEVRKELRRKMGWGEKVLLTPNEVEQKRANMTAQEMAQFEEGRKQQSSQIRPTEGDVQRMPDMLAGIMGPARRI